MAPVRNLDEANEALGKIAKKANELSRVKADAEERINIIRQEADSEAKPLKQQIKALESGLTAFSEMSREELFSEKKTKEVLYGMFGFRKSTKISVTRKSPSTVELMKEMKWNAAIKVKETPDKTKLADYSDEDLKKVNARRKIKDTFWYEIKEEHLE